MFSLDFETGSGWLHVTAHGILDERSDRLTDERVMQECLRRGLGGALIDIRAMQGRLGIVANHQAASDFGSRTRGVLARVAIVDLPAFAERSDLFEDTAVNRGANVRFFESIDAAKAPLGAA